MEQNLNLDNISHIHFIGIGGIGMSALARMMHDYGKVVSGSDMTLSPITDNLEKLGITVTNEQNMNHLLPLLSKEGVGGCLVIYSLALKKYAPELLDQIQAQGIPMLTYPQMLGLLTQHFRGIAITGTHGKTTTTGMCGNMLVDLGVSPSVVVGGILAGYESNYIAGTSDYFVVEGCEYQRSFLNLHPEILIITNIESDHLDYYTDFADIQSAFSESAHRVSEQGYIICNADDPALAFVIDGVSATVVNYMHFYRDDIDLKTPGEYNKKNAAIALALASLLKLDLEKAKDSLESFAGVHRRFEYKGKSSKGALVYDDYAHHPTEIQSLLAGMREKFPDKKILAFFEPHLYSRTKDFFDGFAASFFDGDDLGILPIYYAREKDTGLVSSDELVVAIAEQGVNVQLFPDYDSAVNYVHEHADVDTVIVTIGAGTVWQIGEKVVG